MTILLRRLAILCLMSLILAIGLIRIVEQGRHRSVGGAWQSSGFCPSNGLIGCAARY